MTFSSLAFQLFLVLGGEGLGSDWLLSFLFLGTESNKSVAARLTGDFLQAKSLVVGGCRFGAAGCGVRLPLDVSGGRLP